MDGKENRDYKKKETKKERNAKFTKIACYALRVFLFFYIKGIFFLRQIKIHTFQRKDKSVIIPLRKSSIVELSPRKLLPWFQRKCVNRGE